ncbi:NlpC/P60 family protein [Streptomyces sp. NBC_01506]|uniref:C40 family peptidase n=1 Tax=Streptomyces sp. NBC_01506 TaxID=2903887 RepID=UPI00386A5501
MASHRRPQQPRRAYPTVFAATAAALAISAQSAQADPLPDPTKKGVQAQVDRLYEEATQATETYNGANEKQKTLRKQADNLQDSVARGQEELNALRDSLGSVASAQYRGGGLDPSLQLLLSSAPDDYLDKASNLERASSRQANVMRQAQAKQRLLDQQRAQATAKLGELAETRTELGAKKRLIQGKLAEAQRLLNTLTAEERAKMEQEQERADRSSERADLGNEASASSRGAAALDAAKSRVGMPYVWAASGPNSFDCSGLTSWAFKQAGVSIPRTSQAQAEVGTRINSLGDLKPGDLIIMRTDLSHVGFYAGNGQILHSPKPGASVRYESIARSGMPFMWGVRL